MKHRISELEKIHKELFTTSLEYKYYSLGVAQGISFVYGLIQEYKGRSITSEQWMDIIKNSVSQEEKISEYFNRLIESNDNKEFGI